MHNPLSGVLAAFCAGTLILSLGAAPAPTAAAGGAAPASARLAPADVTPLLNMVLQGGKSISEPFTRDPMLGKAAKLAARAGDCPTALAICSALDFSGVQEAGGWLIAFQTVSGDARGARASAAQLKLNDFSEGFIFSRAVARAMAGDLPGARAEAARIESRNDKAKAYLIITRLSRQKTDLAAAMAALGRDVGMLGEFVAEAQASVGDMQAARQTAQSLTDKHDRAGALWRIARVQARAGDILAARKMVAEFPADDMLNHDQVMVVAAVVQAKAGDIDGLTATINSMQFPLRKMPAKSLIAYAQARKGDVSGAKTLADSLKQNRLISPMYLAHGMIAAAQLDAGDAAGARQTLEDARAQLEWIRAGEDRAEAALLLLRGVIEGPDAMESHLFVDYD